MHTAANHGCHEGVDVEAVDDLVLVHVGFGLVWAAEKHFDKRVDIETVYFAVKVDVANLNQPEFLAKKVDDLGKAIIERRSGVGNVVGSHSIWPTWRNLGILKKP